MPTTPRTYKYRDAVIHSVDAGECGEDFYITIDDKVYWLREPGELGPSDHGKTYRVELDTSKMTFMPIKRKDGHKKGSLSRNFKATAKMYHARVFFKLKRDAEEVRNILKMVNRDADSHVVFNDKLGLHGVEMVGSSRPFVAKSIDMLHQYKWISKPQHAKLTRSIKPVGVAVTKIRKKPFKRVRVTKKFIKVKR